MIETERLLIRYLDQEDIDRLVTYRNKPEVARFQSWNHYSRFEAKGRIRYVQKHPYTGKPKDNTQLAITLKDGTLIGDLHLEVLNRNTVTIGYTLDSTYWGQGYGREAVRGLLEALKEFPQRKVIAYIYRQNDRSRKLLLDLGFHKFDESSFYDDEGYILRLDEEGS